MLPGPAIAGPGAKTVSATRLRFGRPTLGAAKVRDVSDVDPTDGPEEVHLANVDAAVPKYGVDH
jgi:hypothetical protein